MQQKNTTACFMRDKLLEEYSSGNLTLEQITNGLIKKNIPDWLQYEIIQMCDFNKNNRFECPVEQAMKNAINIKTTNKILIEQ